MIRQVSFTVARDLHREHRECVGRPDRGLGFFTRRAVLLLLLLLLACGAWNNDAAMSTPAQERDALVKLYESTGGANWRNSGSYEGATVPNNNWLTGDPCDDNWYGISCSAAGVSKVALGQVALDGTIPTEMGALTSLSQSLSLDENDLRGTVPSELGRLSGLQNGFDLFSNSLSGYIPTQLGSLSNLNTDFDIHGNHFSGTIPSELGRLSTVAIPPIADSPAHLHADHPSRAGSRPRHACLSLLADLLQSHGLQIRRGSFGSGGADGSLSADWLGVSFLIEIPLAKASSTEPALGRTSWLKMDIGMARVATALGTSTIPERRPSHGQHESNR